MHTSDVAIAWFSRDDYDQIRSLVPDRTWRGTYDDWLDDAEQAIRGLEAKGMHAVKAHIHADTFATWCRLTARAANNAALDDFANNLAGKTAIQTHITLG
ncbi:hypothetical protein [Tahibacter amnicola]|uniref:Amidohydrolase n=1 Tax=Tahibacter amnicola TaxID=2976241 RepID=A0ABY6BDM2_9GAMM|nr:hypothetical protein [Tahibacter amnicola]UXI67642.1 hypothetical protein N4264_23350 [Tahibacter amnicola]